MLIFTEEAVFYFYPSLRVSATPLLRVEIFQIINSRNLRRTLHADCK